MVALCRLELFGEVRLLREDRVITRFRTRKAAHLLACLALPPGRQHTRDTLVDRFWPDLEPEAGRDNLSTSLSLIRKTLESGDVPRGAVLIADRVSVRLNSAVVTTDVQECDDLLRKAAGAPDPLHRSDLLCRAVGLIRGELVPDCYDDWILPEQRQWAERHVDALLAWSQALEEAGELEKALEVGARAAAADPLREEACARRLRLYTAMGRYSDARVCYREYERRLEVEAGESPPASLRRMVDGPGRSMDSAVLTEVRTSRREEPSGCEIAFSPLDAMVAPRFRPLPQTLDDFYGRQTAVERLIEILSPAEGSQSTEGRDTLTRHPRVVTVTGPGGVGKTRLAVEVAHRLSAAYVGRRMFVPLDSLYDARRIPGMITRALGLSSSPEADVLECLSEALGSAPVLVVLDNFEQLLVGSAQADARTLIHDMLAWIPGLRCLVTSRQSLAVAGEFELRLPTLSTPTQAGRECDSVALFLERARHCAAALSTMDLDLDDVSAVCDRLEGVPLAIEMAAAWTPLLPLKVLRERLEQGTRDLEARRRDVPDRHRSLHAMMEWSSGLLEPELRRAFAQLSVFRGGWTLAAAEAVIGENALVDLADLVERSLVVVEEQGARYRYLETVREFAWECLGERMEAETQERHARFYLGQAMETAAQAPGLDPSVWSPISRDYANLHASLEWLAGTSRAEELAQVVARLKGFWSDEEHHLNDGVTWTERVLSLHVCRDASRVAALRIGGWLAYCQARIDAAREFYEESVGIARELGEPSMIAATCIDLARLLADVGDAAGSRRLCEESVALLRHMADDSALADGLFDVAGVMVAVGDWDSAEILLRESAALQRSLNRQRELAHALYALATRAKAQGESDTARALWEECVKIDEALGVRGGGALWGLGMLADDRGDAAGAVGWYRRSLQENLESRIHRGVAEGLQMLVAEMLKRGSLERSARLLGASLRQQNLSEQAFRSLRRKQVDALTRDLRERLGSERFEDLLQEGWQMDAEAAINLGLMSLQASPNQRR